MERVLTALTALFHFSLQELSKVRHRVQRLYSLRNQNEIHQFVYNDRVRFFNHKIVRDFV
jgi:hypothetical protein